LRSLRTVADIRVAVALLFACTLATPHAPLVYHTHPGGEQAHVHVDASLLALFGIGDAAAHRPARTTATDPRPAYARDRGAAGGHVHQQQLFQAAAMATAIFVAMAAPLGSVIGRRGWGAPTRAAATATARAPPLSPAV
jgi:hypothetical protein